MAKSKQTPVGSATREALILAAERLIADRGIDGVSLRQINSEAGQRNSSAAHYHFGSKNALIRSIYEYRLDSVNRRRQAMLDTLVDAGRERDVRGIVATFIRPIVDEIRGSEGGSFYIRFLSQAVGHPQADARDYAGSILTDAAMTAYELLRQALPDIDDPILGQRFGLMWEMIIHSLADRERYADPAASDADLFVENLIDTVAGGLAAPVSTGAA
ncbi:MAG: TetR/AcrR family transcriptional regulator [Gammaproteobacteria bacterium]